MVRRLNFSVALFVLATILATFAGAEDTFLHGLDRANIYQRIKDVDQNGLSVRRFIAQDGDSEADIVLDEQGVAVGGRSQDAASRPLFRQVKAAKLTQGTYPEFIKLLDNYVVRSSATESYTGDEQQEIDAFLDEAVATRPMKVALAYINGQLGYELTGAQFRDQLEKIWFELYENHFGNRNTPFCSGFEHVFVGEGQFAPGGGMPRRGEISGYHSWVQFYRQEVAGEVNYLGHKYDLAASRMPANPGLITLRMTWNHDSDGPGDERSVELYKPKGGFFVGTSPECELAMGTVAYFEQEEGLLTDDKRRTAIDGATYDLVLYRSVTANGNRGDRIRSFYPALVGLAQPILDPAVPSGDGPIVVVRALPNPDGDDETGEWVDLKNTSDLRVDLAAWELRDRRGGKRQLDGSIEPNQVRQFPVPRSSHTMRMGNGGGTIRLFHEQELMHEVEYRQAASGKIVEF